MNKIEIIELIKNNQIIFEEIPKELLDDKDVAMGLLENNLNIFGFLGESVREDREVAKLAISINSENILYLGSNLRKNIEFHKELLNDGKLCLAYVAKEVRNSKVFMRKATVSGKNFEYIGEELWKDEGFIKSLVINNFGRNILSKESKYDNVHLRDSKRLWLDLLNMDIGIMQLMSENVTDRLKEDKDFILKVLRPDGLVFFFDIAERLKSDKEILIKFAKCAKSVYLGMVPNKVCKDTDFLIKILSQYEQDNKLDLKNRSSSEKLVTLIKILENDEFKNVAKNLMLLDNGNNDDVNDHTAILKYLKKVDNILEILLNEMRNKKEKDIMYSLITDAEVKKAKKIKF